MQLQIHPIRQTINGRDHYRCPCCSNKVRAPKTEKKRGRPTGTGNQYLFKKFDNNKEILEEIVFNTIQELVDNREEFTQWGQAYRLLKNVYTWQRGSKRFKHLSIEALPCSSDED